MKNKSALVKWFPFILIGVFAVITAFTVYMNGDDYLWYYSVEDSALDVWRTPNGRLFSNQMTIWLVRSYWFRTLFIAATLAAFLILLGKLTDFEKKLGSARYYIALFLLVTIPCHDLCGDRALDISLYELRHIDYAGAHISSFPVQMYMHGSQTKALDSGTFPAPFAFIGAMR